MVKMIAKKAHVYGGKRMQVGDEYKTAGERDARLMKALGRADRAPVYVAPHPAPPAPVEKVKPKKLDALWHEPAAKSLVAEDEQTEQTATKRTYKTRALKAE